MAEAKKILIGEDEPDTSLVLKDRLEMEGYRVVTASDGVEAFERLLESKADLVLMDVMMPRMNGYQFCRKIKAHEELAKTPVILLTAKGQESDKYWGQESGCNDYMTKPFEMEDLLIKIRSYLQK